MATRSSSSDASDPLFWRVTLALTSVFTSFWLLTMITDWIPRAFRGYQSYPNLDNYGFIDTVALLVDRSHVFLLVALAFLNVLAVGICLLGRRRLPITIPTLVYVGMFVVIGSAIIFSDVRLYATGLNAGDEAFTMTVTWCLLAVPLWIFVIRAVWLFRNRRLNA